MIEYFLHILFEGKSQTERLKQVEELKAELHTLMEAKNEEEKKQINLKEEHASITEELAKEKVTSPEYTSLFVKHCFSLRRII